MDPTEPHWRINSSFSPPLSRRWDCRFRSDGASHGTRGAHISGSSVSSLSKGSRSMISNDQYPNHHHSVSDGALSYFGSPSDNFQAPRWTPPARRYDLGEFSTPSGGARPESSVFADRNERSSVAGASSVSNSLGSVSPLSESCRWASSSKHPLFFPPRNFSGRRSFMSKPVYPLVFRNPVSDSEDYGLADASISSRMTPSDHNRTSPISPEGTSSSELRFHKNLTELHKLDTSPEPWTSSRRDGFRWSNASSYDFGFDGESINITDHIGLDNPRSPNNSAPNQKCGLCGRFLWQKSPWSSHRMVRNGDMPIAGILPCRHVFHADCLDEATPKGQINEPPCSVCTKTVASEGSTSFSEPLPYSQRPFLKIHGPDTISKSDGSSASSDQDAVDFSQQQSLPMFRRRGALIKNNFKRRFTLKGKVGKELFGTNIFRKTGQLSSSVSEDVNQPGCSRARHTSRFSGVHSGTK